MNKQKTTGLFIGISAILIPRFVAAQSEATYTYFTRQALTVGFIVLSVIVLVFLGLLLKARVNEYQSLFRKDIKEKQRLNPLQQLMGLDEEEIKSLLEKRTKGN